MVPAKPSGMLPSVRSPNGPLAASDNLVPLLSSVPTRSSDPVASTPAISPGNTEPPTVSVPLPLKSIRPELRNEPGTKISMDGALRYRSAPPETLSVPVLSKSDAVTTTAFPVPLTAIDPTLSNSFPSSVRVYPAAIVSVTTPLLTSVSPDNSSPSETGEPVSPMATGTNVPPRTVIVVSADNVRSAKPTRAALAALSSIWKPSSV